MSKDYLIGRVVETNNKKVKLNDTDIYYILVNESR